MIRASSIAIASALLLLGTAVRAEEPATSTQAAAPAAAPAPAPAAAPDPAAAPAAAPSRPYIEAASSFLKGLAHSARGGEAGEKGWQEAQAVAADKIAFKIAGRDIELDLSAKKSAARVVRFEKLSTLRDGPVIKGVSVENIEVRLGSDAYHAKGRVMLDEKDGKWTVTAVEVD